MKMITTTRLTATIAFAGALACAGVEAAGLEQKRATYAVELATPMSLREIVAATDLSGLQVQELIHVFSSTHGDLTVGHFADKGGDALEADYRRSLLATLDDLGRTDPGQPVAAFAYDPLPAMVEAARAELDEQGLRVSVMIVEGPRSAQPALEILGTVGVVPAAGSVPAPAPEPNVGILAACSQYFVAATTSVYSGPSSFAGKRYINQNISWDAYNYSTLRACGSSGNITYEQEFVTNNYDRRNYFGNSVDGWSSTMPNAYLDTRAGDSENERNYAIGCSDALRIASYTTYNTYIRLNYGNWYNDTAKVTGQRGHRIPSFCHSTWCIWADATEFIARAWIVPVPGSGTYYH